jgi:hypothetical protein
MLLRNRKLLWSLLKMLLSFRRTQPPVDCLWCLEPSFSRIKRKSLIIFLFLTWYYFCIHLYVTICMKLDPGMHIGLHLVFFGKIGVTPPHPSIHQSRRHEGEAPGGSRRPPQVLELLRRWPRPCPSRHGWPCMGKPWWSSGTATCIRQVVCTFNIRWWYKSILVFTLIYYELCLFICVATTCL